MVEERTLELRKALHTLKEVSIEVVNRLSTAAEFRDTDTGYHIQRMSRYSGLLARHLKMSDDEVELIMRSSPLHDVGKIAIPDSILLKPGSLDSVEWGVMQKHADFGADILAGSDLELINVAESIARTHHEKWDGSGYPNGLAEEDIPLVGRICAVADVFDALTSNRPYKEAFSVDVALDIMEQGRGSHFDPRVLDALVRGIDDVLAIKRQFSD